MAYGDSNYPAVQQGQQPYQDDMMYDYPASAYAGRPPSDQAAQVRQAIFDCPLPETEEDFQKWIPMMSVAVDAVARIPGIDGYSVDKLNRKFKFLINRASSQGSKHITSAMAQEFIFLLRSLVAKGDTPLQGLTGVGAMITTHTQQKTEMKYPMQQQASFGLRDLIPWGKR